MGILKTVAAAMCVAVAATLVARRLRRGEKRVSRKELLRRAYQEAAGDVAYQAEMAEIDRAFDVAVGDGLERLTPADA